MLSDLPQLKHEHDNAKRAVLTAQGRLAEAKSVNAAEHWRKILRERESRLRSITRIRTEVMRWLEQHRNGESAQTTPSPLRQN